MSVIGSNILAGASGAGGGYQISRSVRLRSSASAYFSRTPASAGNRRTWTWSGWVKRGTVSPRVALFGFGTSSAGGSASGACYFDSNTIYVVSGGGTSTFVSTTPVYRDPSAWYHVVIAFDSTQATASNRVKIYINGSQVTALANTTYPSQNYDSDYNNTTPQYLGARGEGGLDSYFDGYITEINSIDGQALTPSSFGETNTVTGVWQPKKYTGTYGTNGFYLNFSDNSAATAAAIGKDYSGNGNNWTPNNISVTAGVTYDSMLDVPTQWADGGNGRGNYATWNPLNVTQSTLSQGNLFSSASGSSTNVISTFPTATTGKWYAEIVLNFSVNINWPINIGASDGGNTYCRLYTDWSAIAIFKSVNGTTSNVTPSGAFPANNDILKIAYDADAGKLWLGLNSNWYGTSGSLTGDPATGTDATVSGIAGKQIYPNHSNAGGPAQNAYLNCGQRPFAYTPPTGFKALNTLNLPTPTILKGNQYFDAVTRTGTGSSDGVSQVISSLAFTPDLVWNKARSNAFNHNLVDSARGNDAILFSNLTNAETSVGTTGTQLQLTTNGFTAIQRVSYQATNQNGVTYADWCWKEGATQGFDIVTYTGNGAASQTLSHSLGVAPAMIITKQRSATGDWFTYHRNANASPQNGALFLNLTNAFTTNSGYWNNTAPTSSQFTVGSAGGLNANGVTAVAYLFAEVAGFSKFGSYTGNGSADGPMVFTGFRPRWVMIKRTDAANDWLIIDTSRNPNNVTNLNLWANLSSAEGTADRTDILSNGFKLRNNLAEHNASGGTYIFAAFAENPLKFSLAR